MKIIFARAATRELDEIWDWNERTYSAEHANEYIQFLKDQIYLLGDDHRHCKPVEFRVDLHWVMIRRKSRGHGHIVVFCVSPAQIAIVNVFHSAQDWRARLQED